ncbi:hypothetical protein AQI95_10550 [Streptomyces yokosukanensis]|uniref:Secreted protein n=2 Tax=Streptomyces yokosukanensis TaxID=67386 RepID=A0A101P9M3_9ACTN|nr:hypothetical protein AQI95_10550 [Streptomyces yokosukanensis]
MWTRAAGAGTAGIALAVAVSGSAHAAADPEYAGCTTTGASAIVRDIQLTASPSGKHDVHFEISDTAKDGRNARVRYLTQMGNGKTRYWNWHANTGGPGTIVVNTTAQDNDNGIFGVGIQVARANGDTILNSCTDWAYKSA